MADKYLYNNAGVITEREATITSTGVAQAGDIIGLDATGRINANMMPAGLTADTASIVSSENLLAGDFVNVYDNAGTATVRKADASNNRPAVGFVLVGVTSPAAATVHFEGTNDVLTGLTAGVTRFLSDTTAGESTATAPTTATNLVQVVGRAIATTKISFEPSEAIVLA